MSVVLWPRCCKHLFSLTLSHESARAHGIFYTSMIGPKAQEGRGTFRRSPDYFVAAMLFSLALPSLGFAAGLGAG
jgi:hypothetical protein